MAPTRRSARAKANEVRAATPPATGSTISSRATRAKPVAKPSPKKVARATRSRKTASPEPEVVEDEDEDEEERDSIEAVRAHVKKSTTPADTIASLKQSPKSKSTRGRVAKKAATKKIAAAPVDENVDVVEDIVPATRKSTRGKVVKSEIATSPTHLTESKPVSETPVVKGRPKRTGKKVNPFEEPEHPAESSTTAVTPHWAKRTGRKANVRDTSDKEAIKKPEVEVEAEAEVGTDSVIVKGFEGNTKTAEDLEVAVKKPSGDVEVSESEQIIKKTKGRKKKVTTTKRGRGAARKPGPTQQSEARIGQDTEMAENEVDQNTEVDVESEVEKIDTIFTDVEQVNRKMEMDVVGHEVAIEDQSGDVEINTAGPAVGKPKKGRAKKARKGTVSKGGRGKKKVEVVQDDDEEATQPDVQTEDTQMGEDHEAPISIEPPVTDSGIFVDSQASDIGNLVEDPSEQIGAAESEPIVAKGKGRKKPRKAVSTKGKKKAEVIEDGASNNQQNASVQDGNKEPIEESKIQEDESIIVQKLDVVETAITVAGPETVIVKGVEVVDSNVAIHPEITPTMEVGNTAVEEKIGTEQLDDATERSDNLAPIELVVENESAAEQESSAHLTKPRRKAKKSAATQKKERAAKAAAKRAKNEPEALTVDVEGDSNVDAVEGDGYKSVSSSSRTVDPAVVLGSKRASGIRKTEKRKAAPLFRANTRRGRSAVDESGAVIEDDVNGELIEEALGEDINGPRSAEQVSETIEKESVAAVKEVVATSKISTDNELEVVNEPEEAILEEKPIGGITAGTIVQDDEGDKVEALEGVTEKTEEDPEEEDDVSLPMPRAPIILSPTRLSSDPNVDPVKSSAPSSPVTRSASHQHHNSSPLRNENSNPVLASPSQVATPRASPSKKLSTPNARTPINSLSQTGTPYGRNLEDSRDIKSTPTRPLDVNIASSPVMLPPTPNIHLGHPRSPVKQTPTKEPGSVKGDVTLGDFGLAMGGGGRSLHDNSTGSVMSSPTKNSSPIQGSLVHSSPAGRLSFGPSDMPQSSPIVGRLDSEHIPLLSSPIAATLINTSPTKSSPLKKSNLDFLRQPLTPPSARNSWPLQSESVGSPVGDDTFADRSSYRRIEDELVGGYGEEDDEEEELRPYAPDMEEAQEEEDEVEGQKTSYTNMLPDTEEGGEEEADHSGANDSRASIVDESELFKLADKARSVADEDIAAGDHDEEVVKNTDEHRRILTSRVSDLDFSVLEQVHPKLAQPESHTVNPQAVGNVDEEGGEEETDIAECDLTFTAVDNDGIECPSSPIEDIGDILSPIKFDYAPTNEIFPPKAENVLPEVEAEAFSPIMPYDHTFDTSAVLWDENEDDEDDEDEEDEDEQVTSFSTCDRLRAVRASSPPNIWDKLESRTPHTSDAPLTSPTSPNSPQLDEQTDFDMSYARGLAQEEGEEEDENADGPGEDTLFEQSFARGLEAEQEQQYESINMLPDEGDETDFEQSFMRGREEEMEQMKREEEEEQKEKEMEERIERGKKRFADSDGSSPRKRVKGNGARRHTFNPGEEEAKKMGPGSRRRSHPGVIGAADRQFYLQATNPEKIAKDWAEHIERVTSERAAVAVIQGAWKRYMGAKAANLPTHRPTVVNSSALQQAPMRPSRIPGARRLRSVSNTVAPSSSIPTPTSSSGGDKRKADETLESGTNKSNIPVSARSFIGRGGVEKVLVKRNTEHNALYSVSVKYQPVCKNQKRPSSLDVETATRMAAMVAREMRERAEEEGKVLHPGEQEEYVASVKEGKGVKWDDKLVYCEGDLSETYHSHPKAPGRSILASKPLLTAMGNWVPAPGAATFVVPKEVVVVKKVVYSDDKKGKGRKW